MRLLVCGGRDFNDYRLLSNAIAEALEWVPTGDEANDSWLPPNGTLIIAGGARGADTLAIDWAVIHWTHFKEYKADWAKHGKAAGHIRNQQMLDEGKPDMVLAMPGGRGTADMVRRAKKAGIPVKEIFK